MYINIFLCRKKYDISTLLPEEIQAVTGNMSNFGDQYKSFRIIYNSVIEMQVIAVNLKEL